MKDNTKKKNRKIIKGISLIVLIITIVVTLILLSVVLLTMDKNDPRKGATENVFKSDFKTLQDQLAMKKVEVIEKDKNADVNVSITYDKDEELKEWISSIDTSILNGIVEICNGELVFVDNNMSDEEKIWAEEMAAVIDSCESYSKKRGGYYFKGKVGTQEIANYSWTNSDVTVEVDTSKAEDMKNKYDSYTYSIDSGDYQKYNNPFKVSTDNNTTKIFKIKGVATSSKDSKESIDFVEDYVVKIDKIAPTAPDITRTIVDGKTQITLSGAKDADSGVKLLQYSLDGGNSWNDYSSPIQTSTNVTQVFSRAWDNAGNVTPEKEWKKINIKVSQLSDIVVTSPSTGIYKAGTRIVFVATFQGGAPAAVPSLDLTFGQGNVKGADIVNRSTNSITYSYVIEDGDNGKLELANGRYNGQDQKLNGSEVIADTIKPKITYTGANYNGTTQKAIITSINDQVNILFKASDLNINESVMIARDIKVLLDGTEIDSLSRELVTSSPSGEDINFKLVLSDFRMEKGNVSLIIPADKVDDKAFNYNDEIRLDTNYYIECRIDTTPPEVDYVEMYSDNEFGGKKYAKNGNTINLRVRFNENLSVAPTITIAGRTATLKSSAPNSTEYEGYIYISESEVALGEAWLGYTISDYKDFIGNPGKTVEKESTTTKPTYMDDTVLYDRTEPNINFNPTYRKKDKTTINDINSTNGYCYDAVFSPNATDNLSGILSVAYRWNTTDAWTKTVQPSPSDTGTYTLYADITDNSGNKITKTHTIKVDWDSPIVPEIKLEGTLGTNGWYTSEVVPKLVSTPTDALSGFDYGTFSPEKLSTSGTFTYTCYDKVGNPSTASKDVKVDAVEPKILFSVFSYENSNKSSSPLVSKEVGNNGVVESYEVAKVPSTSSKDWVKFPVMVDAKVQNSIPSGITSVTYYVNEEENYGSTSDNFPTSETLSPSTVTWNNTMKIPTGGRRILRLKIATGSGKEFTYDVEVNIDVTAPSIETQTTLKSKSGTTLDGSKTNGYAYNATVGVTATDNESGVAERYYEWSDINSPKAWTSFTSTSLSTLASFSTGTKYLHLKVVDNAGNERVTYVTVNLDRTAPTLTFSTSDYNASGGSIDISKTGNYSHHSNVTISCKDTNSGVDTKQYKWGSSSSYSNLPTTSSVKSPGTTGTHTLYARITDKVGNYVENNISRKIDVTPPSKASNFAVNHSFYKGNSPENSSVTFTVVGATDSQSGISTYNFYRTSSIVAGSGPQLGKSNNWYYAYPDDSKYTLEQSSSGSSVTFRGSKSKLGKFYSVYIKIYDKVGNSLKIDKGASRNFYEPCNHYFGDYYNFPTSTTNPNTNYVVEKYYSEGWSWRCTSDNQCHVANINNQVVLRRCMRCKMPAAYLYWLGNEPKNVVGVNFFHPSGSSLPTYKTNSYNNTCYD